MKSIILFLSLIVLTGLVSYGQDTINHTIGGCAYDDLKSTNSASCQRGIFFNYTNDTLRIYGTIGANCCGTHFAIIKQIKDTIYISTVDTGLLCTCTCAFCFEIKLPATVTDTMVYLNGTLYNTKSSINSVRTVNELKNAIKLVPNPADNLIVITNENYVNDIKQIRIINTAGITIKSIKVNREEHLMIDLSSFKSGIYYIRFDMINNEFITKEFIKK